MEHSRRRLCILLTLALALMAVTPALSFAARPRPNAVAADAYESDDTSATAKSLPYSSFHTLKSVEGEPDQDWSVRTIVETGAPLIADTSWREGWGAPVATMLMEDEEAAEGLLPLHAGSILWGGFPLPSAMLAYAPAPGRYFTRVDDALGPQGGGAYGLVQKQGLAFRIGGADRFETAAAVSQQMWPAADQSLDEYFNLMTPFVASPDGCVLATGRGYADALAASAWVSSPFMPSQRMPILLTERDSIPDATANEILRLAGSRRQLDLPFTVYIVGGEPVVGSAVLDQLDELNETGDWSYPISDVVRIAGPDRFATASAIASAAIEMRLGVSDTVFIVNGFAFPDALSAGPVASKIGAPVLLVQKDSVPDATAEFIADHPEITRAVVVGSSSVVASSVIESLGRAPFSLETTRVFGADRYATSRAAAKYGVEYCNVVPGSIVAVTGANYPDGLSAAGLTAFTYGPVLLTRPDVLSPTVSDHYSEFPTFWPSYVIGSERAVSADVMESFDDMWRLRPLGPGSK